MIPSSYANVVFLAHSANPLDPAGTKGFRSSTLEPGLVQRTVVSSSESKEMLSELRHKKL
jgi:hypothetical protein